MGHYLMLNIYMVTKTTSYMFFTAMAGNILALKMIEDICHIKLSWGGWALAAGLRHYYVAADAADYLQAVSARIKAG